MNIAGGSRPKGLKGLPKRAMNARKAALRQECYLRGERRKDARRKAQAERERLNGELRQSGQPTAWQVAEAKRTARRAA